MRTQDYEFLVDVFKNHLEPNETELYLIYGMREQPSLVRFIPYIGMLICAIMAKSIFLGLTNCRILIMENSMFPGLDEKNMRSIEFSEIRSFRVEVPIRSRIMPLSVVEKTLHITLNTGEEYRIKTPNGLTMTETQEKDLKEICTKLKEILDRGSPHLSAHLEEMTLPKEIRKPKWPKMEKGNEIAMFSPEISLNARECDESTEYYVKAIEMNPKNALAHYNYANLLEDAGRFEEAARHYVEAMEISSGFARLYKQRHARASKKPLVVMVLAVGLFLLMLLDQSLMYLIRKGIEELIFG